MPKSHTHVMSHNNFHSMERFSHTEYHLSTYSVFQDSNNVNERPLSIGMMA